MPCQGIRCPARAWRFYMKKAFLILILSGLMVFSLWADEKADFAKGKKLFDDGKYQEALKVVEEGIKKYGETEMWLYGKFGVLMKLKKFDKALEIAIKRDKIAEKKSPWTCFDIADLYLKMKKYGPALDWIEKAAERGFKDYRSLEVAPEFQGLKDKTRLSAVIKKIKQNVGIGKPPKDFTVKTLKDKEFTLSKYKGKVILIDFWATWCKPCVKEIPALKKFYAEYKPKGFEIIGISLDDKKANLTAFLAKEDLMWPIAFSGNGWADPTARNYGINSIPSTWLIDKKGNLRHFGYRGEELGKAIGELLAE